MAGTIIHLRKDGVVRRLVGPRAEVLVEERIAAGWERFTPPQPYGAEAPEPEHEPELEEATPNMPTESPVDDAPAEGDETSNDDYEAPGGSMLEEASKRPRRSRGSD